jgi:hypothetical protein
MFSNGSLKANFKLTRQDFCRLKQQKKYIDTSTPKSMPAANSGFSSGWLLGKQKIKKPGKISLLILRILV